MERHNPNQELDHLVDTVRLARAVFELAKQTPISKTGQLELIRDVALNLGSVLDGHRSRVHLDLGQEIHEYVLLKLDGEKCAEWMNDMSNA